jgi:hypothetical protein
MSRVIMRRTLTGLALALALAGCGGGDATPAPTTSFDIDAAVRALATGPDDVFVLAGSILGVPATLQAVHAAMPDGVFSTFGTLNRMRRTATFDVGGTVESASEDDYLNLAARTFYGAIDSEGSNMVSTARTPYPATATIGASGMLFDAGAFDSLSNPLGRVSVSWSLEAVAGTPAQAWWCINTQFQDVAGTPTGDYEHDCYRIDAAGTLLGMRMTMTSPAFGTIVFQ